MPNTQATMAARDSGGAREDRSPADIGRRGDEDLAIEIWASLHTSTAAEPWPTIFASPANHPPNQPTCTPT
jgi:hypothetical protein